MVEITEEAGVTPATPVDGQLTGQEGQVLKSKKTVDTAPIKQEVVPTQQQSKVADTPVVEKKTIEPPKVKVGPTVDLVDKARDEQDKIMEEKKLEAERISKRNSEIVGSVQGVIDEKLRAGSNFSEAELLRSVQEAGGGKINFDDEKQVEGLASLRRKLVENAGFSNLNDYITAQNNRYSHLREYTSAEGLYGGMTTQKVTNEQLDDIKNYNPDLYDSYLLYSKNKTDLERIRSNGDAIYGEVTVDDTPTDGNVFEDIMKDMTDAGIINPESDKVDLKAEYDIVMNTPEMKEATERMNKAKEDFYKVKDDMDAIDKDVERELKGSDVTDSYVRAIAQNRKNDLVTDYNELQTDYQLSLDNYNSMQASAGQKYNISVQQAEMDRADRYEQFGYLKFGYGIYANEQDYERGLEAEKRAFETYKSQIDYQYTSQYGDINSSDKTTRKKAIDSAVDEEMARWEAMGIPMQRSKEQIKEDITKLVDGGASLGEAITTNISNNVRDKPEYKAYIKTLTAGETTKYQGHIDSEEGKAYSFNPVTGNRSVQNIDGEIESLSKKWTDTVGGGVLRYGSSEWSPGLDISGTKGSPITAPIEGDVVNTGYNPDKGGNWATIKDKDGNLMTFSHLDETTAYVGQHIYPGQSVGTMGNTGKVLTKVGGVWRKPTDEELTAGKGTHLDLTMRNGKTGKLMTARETAEYVNSIGTDNLPAIPENLTQIADDIAKGNRKVADLDNLQYTDEQIKIIEQERQRIEKDIPYMQRYSSPEEKRAETDRLGKSFKATEQYVKYNATKALSKDLEATIDDTLGGAGDLATIFLFMKGLDPTSVVRESEYAAAANSLGFGSTWTTWMSKLGSGELKGDLFKDEDAQKFRDVIKRVEINRKQNLNKTIDFYRKNSLERGINPSYTLGGFDTETPTIKSYEDGSMIVNSDPHIGNYLYKDKNGNWFRAKDDYSIDEGEKVSEEEAMNEYANALYWLDSKKNADMDDLFE